MWPFDRRARALLERFAGKEISDSLLAGREQDLKGKKSLVTLSFLTVHWSDGALERMDPVYLLKCYHQSIGAIADNVAKTGGFVINIFGDLVFAVWNAPKDIQGHEESACLAAIDADAQCRRAFANECVMRMRAGINTGSVVTGLVQFGKRLQYAALGDEVNVASSLEGANKFFGSGILASGATISKLSDKIVRRPLGRVRILGRGDPLEVFELMGRRDSIAENQMRAHPEFLKGVEAFQARKYEQGRGCFERFLAAEPDDRPAKLFASMCEDYAKTPPPDDWDGVFNLTAR